MILFKSEDLGISAKNYANNSENKKKTFWNSNQNRQKCLCCIKWWRLCSLTANFSLKDFYAQTIKKFVIAIPDLIESYRTAKKVSANQKTLKGSV